MKPEEIDIRADELISVPGNAVDVKLVKEVWKAGYKQALDDLFQISESKLPDKWSDLKLPPDLSPYAYMPVSIQDAFQALIKLYHIRAEYWRQAGDWEPDWTDAHIQTSKECIIISKNKIERSVCRTMQPFLVFKPGTGQRDHFLQHHRKLIEQAKQLL